MILEMSHPLSFISIDTEGGFPLGIKVAIKLTDYCLFIRTQLYLIWPT